MPKIVDWYMDGKIKIDDLITHKLPLDDINRAFDLMHAGEVDPQRGGVLGRFSSARKRIGRSTGPAARGRNQRRNFLPPCFLILASRLGRRGRDLKSSFVRIR